MTDLDTTATGSDTGSLRGISLSALRLRRFTGDKVAWALAKMTVEELRRLLFATPSVVSARRPAPINNQASDVSWRGPIEAAAKEGTRRGGPWGNGPSTPLHPAAPHESSTLTLAEPACQGEPDAADAASKQASSPHPAPSCLSCSAASSRLPSIAPYLGSCDT